MICCTYYTVNIINKTASLDPRTSGGSDRNYCIESLYYCLILRSDYTRSSSN